MSSVTVRNLPDATHRALKLRAAQHGRSTEAEIRFILELAVAPKTGMGSALAASGNLRSLRDSSCQVRRSGKHMTSSSARRRPLA